MNVKKAQRIPPVAIVRLAASVRNMAQRLASLLAPAEISMLDLLYGAPRAHLVGAAAELGIADQLTSGPRSVEALAEATGVRADMLGRMLRGLATFGVFKEMADGRFALSPLAATLRSDAPNSLRGMARFVGSQIHAESWVSCAESVRSGRPGSEVTRGAPIFEVLRGDAALSEIFDRAMHDVTRLDAPLIAGSYDFGARTICDVAGGVGVLLAAILERHTQAKGVLVDVEAIRAPAAQVFQRAGVSDRVRFETGDFFERVPSGADLYLLKNVLHDWDDAHVAQILATVRRAAAVGTQLLISEMVLTGDDALRSTAKMLDLQMMVFTGGKERTVPEFEQLLAAARFRLTRVIPLPSPVSLVEAVAV